MGDRQSLVWENVVYNTTELMYYLVLKNTMTQ